jgi:uncharacterized protein (DUF302 family)
MSRIKLIVIGLSAFLAGTVLTALFLHYAAGRSMLLEVKSPYDHEKTVETITARIAAKPGWKIVNIIDQQRAVRDGNAPDPGQVTIIELCNAAFSSRMLGADDRKRMAVNMPIRIAVYQRTTGEVYLGLMNGYLISKIFGGETERIIEEVSLEMEDILRFVNFKYNAF